MICAVWSSVVLWPTFSISCQPRSPGLYTCLVFQFSFVLTFALSGMPITISRHIFFFLSCSISSQFLSIVQSVIISTLHIIVVPLTFMTLSGISWWMLLITVYLICMLLTWKRLWRRLDRIGVANNRNHSTGKSQGCRNDWCIAITSLFGDRSLFFGSLYQLTFCPKL